jgi:DNA mismatch endonuclease (patch repair protein)
MRRVRAKDTKPELLLRRGLHARGKRYRLHVKGLPGKPDVVFPRQRLAIFVHGCFWHRHENCIQASNPKSNREYWAPKLVRNVARDKAHCDALAAMGFRTIVLWECEIEADPAEAVVTVERLLAEAECQPCGSRA